MATTLEYPVITMQAWRLVNEVVEKLNKRSPQSPNLLVNSIKHAVANNVGPAQLIEELQEVAEDRYTALADLIGNELTDKIKSFQ
jgi:hypothetical protein